MCKECKECGRQRKVNKNNICRTCVQKNREALENPKQLFMREGLVYCSHSAKEEFSEPVNFKNTENGIRFFKDDEGYQLPLRNELLCSVLQKWGRCEEVLYVKDDLLL